MFFYRGVKWGRKNHAYSLDPAGCTVKAIIMKDGCP